MLSIKGASTFVVGAALLRQRGIDATGKGFTISDIAEGALGNQSDAGRIRQSILKLANQENAWFRNNPPHAKISEQVLDTRTKEFGVLVAINSAVVSSVRYGPTIAHDDANKEKLKKSLIDAVDAIDNAPGTTDDKRLYFGQLKSQLSGLSQKDSLLNLLQQAEYDYNESLKAKILEKYKPLQRSSDFEH